MNERDCCVVANRGSRNLDQRDASKCHAVGVRWVMRMSESTQLASRAGDRYLLLADISGYTAFMASVESDHGVDFSAGIPAGFAIVGKLLDGVIDGVQPDFEVIKLEGDAVFAVAPTASLDGRGGDVLYRLQALSTRPFARNARWRLGRPGITSAPPARSSPTSTSRSCSTEARPSDKQLARRPSF